MIDKITSLGLKLVSEAGEKVKQSVDELVDKRKISKEEGNSLFDDFKSFISGKAKDTEKLLEEIVNKIIEKMGYEHADEVEKLRRRVAILEKIYEMKKNGKL
ncbi:MAG: phasin family protein [Bacteroidales bacterium]|nr:phasin family protein [Bacteroidales bacterium]